MQVNVGCLNETGFNISEAGVTVLVEAVLAAEHRSGEVAVVFVEEGTIAGLNASYRHLSEPTDVLSFAEESDERLWPAQADGLDEGQMAGADLGEIVIAPAVVLRYAVEEGNSPETQMAWTVVHGVLHLLGYDHETDQGEMRLRERRLLDTLDIAELFDA